ncbi:MAG: hypothetical protein SGBAC_007694 [Bacillariaceae sp.]
MGEEKMNPHAKADANEASSMKTEAMPDQNADDLPQKKKRKPRKPPAVAWKKPKGMPKRPLSAYNLFFKVQRGAIMSARAKDKSEAALKRSKKETVGIGFANLARTIADKWQSLDDNDKSEFLEQAAEEKTRYKQEMVVWRKKQKDEKERQASMPPATVAVAVTDMPPSQQGVATGGMLGRDLYDDSRIHPAFWQGGLQNRFQQHANDLLFGMQQQQPFSHQQPPMMQSYLQELADNTLLQRQQQQLQELQARQLLLAGALDPTPRPQNRPVDASYPGTWFELPSSQPPQQSRQSEALQGTMHQQSTPPSFGNDGELQKLTPGKGFGWQQAQLMQDQHLQQLQNGADLPGVADANMLKASSSDMKKLASTGNPPFKPPPPAEARNMAQRGGGSPQQSLHTLASKLDNDTISFLTGFQFNGNNSTNSSSTDGSTPVVGGANFDDPRTTN